MFTSLTRWILANEVLRGSAAALAIKFTAAIMGFTMFALMSRYLNPSEFGALAVIFNAVAFFAMVSLCGQETLIVRSWAEYCGSNRPALARGVLIFGLQVVVAATLLVITGVAIGWSLWAHNFSPALLFAVCLFLLALALMQFSGQFSRVAAGVVIGEAPRELMWRMLVVITVISYHVVHADLGAAEFFFISAIALFFAMAFQIWQVAPAIPDSVKKATAQRDLRTWIPRSFKMWLAALLDSSGQYLEVVVIGLFLGPVVAGLYFAVTRITSFFAMISGGGSIYATSRISALFYANDKAELQDMLRALAVINGAFIAIGLIVIFAGGKLLLAAFGTPYTLAYPALILMAAGAAIGALAGPAQHILLLTGHEGVYPRIMAAGLCLRFLLIAILGPMFGLMGAVIAWSVSAIVITAALVITCRRMVGLDPSLLSAFERKRQLFAWLR